MPYLVVDNSTITTATPYGLGISTQNIFQSQFKTLDQTFANLKMLLLTKKGELVGDLNFGTDLVNVLFEPNTDNSDLKDDIDTYIRNAIDAYLPDITVERIDVLTAAEDPTLTNDIVITLTISLVLLSISASLIISANQNGTLIIQQNDIIGQGSPFGNDTVATGVIHPG